MFLITTALYKLNILTYKSLYYHPALIEALKDRNVVVLFVFILFDVYTSQVCIYVNVF